MRRVVVTGASGLLGWHALVRLHASNRMAGLRGEPLPYDSVALDHAGFDRDAALLEAVTGADAVLHFAGVSRAPDEDVIAVNPAIARRLVEACRRAGADPHIVYANSTHAGSDTAYGRSKRIAAEMLEGFASRFTNLILPHIFGECARPFYNNVTATLIHQFLAGDKVNVNPEGRVYLLHAGAAVQAAIEAADSGLMGSLAPGHRAMSVPDLCGKLLDFHESYVGNIYPDVSDPFDLALFNSYRAATYPGCWPRPLTLHADARGTLFEAVRGGGGGQTFLSTTKPGVTRGNHFHLSRIERFIVVRGEAVIRIRKVLADRGWEYRVSGDAPMSVDMPTMHTHSIENVGDGDLLTLFWSHDLFDAANPDTYADRVLS